MGWGQEKSPAEKLRQIKEAKGSGYLFDKARAPAIISKIKDIPKKPKKMGRERIPAKMSRIPAATLSATTDPTIPRTMEGTPMNRGNSGKKPMYHRIWPIIPKPKGTKAIPNIIARASTRRSEPTRPRT